MTQEESSRNSHKIYRVFTINSANSLQTCEKVIIFDALLLLGFFLDTLIVMTKSFCVGSLLDFVYNFGENKVFK